MVAVMVGRPAPADAANAASAIIIFFRRWGGKKKTVSNDHRVCKSESVYVHIPLKGVMQRAWLDFATRTYCTRHFSEYLLNPLQFLIKFNVCLQLVQDRCILTLIFEVERFCFVHDNIYAARSSSCRART